MKTAMIGSDPIWKRLLMNERGEVGSDPPSDDKGAITDPPPEDGKEPPADDKVPWDKDPRWTAWREKEKGIDTFMTANNLDSLEDLMTHVTEGRDLKGKLGEKDLKTLLDNNELLESYQEYWAKEEEGKKRQDELPDDTIKRLEDKLADEKRRNDDVDRKQQESKEAKKAVIGYEKEVKVLLSDLSPSEGKFIKEHFGIGNPLNDIDITDTKAVHKMVADGLKKKDEYDQAVIKSYLDGKKEPPVIPSGDPPVEKSPEVKNMKEARSSLREQLGKLWT